MQQSSLGSRPGQGLSFVDGEREATGRQKVVRGSNVPVSTSHTGLNPRSKHASLSLSASLAALRALYSALRLRWSVAKAAW